MSTRVLSRDEADQVLASVTGRPAAVARTRAMIALGYRAGLRLGEVLQLREGELALTKAGCGEVWVRTLKGGPERQLGLDPRTVKLLREHQDLRPRFPDNFRVFTTRDGDEIFSSYVRRTMSILGKRCGLERLHFHLLRHTFARQLYDEGLGVREIQVALGHRSLETTAKYLQSIGATEVVAHTKGREW